MTELRSLAVHIFPKKHQLLHSPVSPLRNPTTRNPQQQRSHDFRAVIGPRLRGSNSPLSLLDPRTPVSHARETLAFWVARCCLSSCESHHQGQNHKTVSRSSVSTDGGVAGLLSPGGRLSVDIIQGCTKMSSIVGRSEGRTDKHREMRSFTSEG